MRADGKPVPARRRREHCPSALRLDQWLAHELAAAESAGIEAHVAGCAVCQAERAARLETRRSFAQQAPPLAELARSARSRRTARLAAGAGLSAAAALVLLVSAPWRVDETNPSDTTRAKGSPASFSWVVRRGEHMFAPDPDERLRPGDALRFTVSAREPTYVALFALDPAGNVSVYHPDGAHLAAIGPGKDQPLPAAIALDPGSGDEQLYGVFCSSPHPVAELRQVIAQSPAAPALPEGCHHQRRALRTGSP